MPGELTPGDANSDGLSRFRIPLSCLSAADTLGREPMDSPEKSRFVTIQDTLLIRVRYHETDGQGRVHHAQFVNYFERGRVELLRSLGHSYRNLEASGLMLVVTEMNIRYLGAAVFDDLLSLTTSVVRARGVRIEHRYEISQVSGDDSSEDAPTPTPIVQASSVIACVDREGKVRRLPDFLRQH